jgi:hypothetical protein
VKVLAVIALGLLAACGEKMTPEKCVKTLDRVAERTEACLAPGEPPPPPASGADAFDAEVMGELCTDEQMQRMALSALPCLDKRACVDYLACLGRADIEDLMRKLSPR